MAAAVLKKASIFSSPVFVLSLLLLFLLERSGAQPPTDPSEVEALNAMMGRWGLKATTLPAAYVWNISGVPCSGAATDNTYFDDPAFNPGIKCDCTYNNQATCHITKLKVHALSAAGTIPEELQNLTYLNNLILSENYLTGPLPAFIGNLTQLEYLTFGANALSGTIPKELGKLQKLISLSITTNNFSGSLPSELGNLTNLQKLYVDSCGASGEFPLAISSLKNLRTLWISDNNFTGKIPDFNATNLTTLRMQGNSFEGPIPSSLSSVTSLTDLRIGEISNGSSTLAFISSLTSLSTLVLRNSRISDTILLDFSRYTSLQMLDLSFNNITGELPQSLFSLSLLTHLFLGNNSLSGGLPTSKSTSLLNIDLSYNQLSGSFPSWVSQQNLKLNLVANNFVVDNSNSSVLPSGLHCLQRDIPCNRGSPIYSSFAIKCGGNETILSSDGTMYEIDSKSLTTASYYVSDPYKWAVSNVGIFMDANNPEYILYSPSQALNTLDPELYETARLSPSSLRYYGLGLENGNYTIKLHFVESEILDPPSWKSVGRRVFDIYIQGNLEEKDFNIRKEAGEASLRAVVKEFIAPVTNNFLEIHFFWSGKGTCCVPGQGNYGSSISAISVYPFDFNSTVSNESPSTSTNKRTGLAAGIAAGAVAFSWLLFLSF